jgi:hypothetical protein
VQLRWDTWGQVCDEILEKSPHIAYGVYVEQDEDGKYVGRSAAELIGDGQRIGLNIETLEGTMLAMEGDYVILGVENEIYPCRASIFEATYEAID